jgi:hypothetical protein
VTQPPGPSPYSQQGSDEQIWRRPDGGTPTNPALSVPTSGPTSAQTSGPAYAGPPRGAPAPSNWRPPTLIQVPAARTLPDQSDAELDEQERSARTVTYGVGMITGAIALLLLFVICGRLVF